MRVNIKFAVVAGCVQPRDVTDMKEGAFVVFCSTFDVCLEFSVFHLQRE